MKIRSFFLFFWVIFALLDPDPDPHKNCGSGSNSSNECGSMRIRIRIRIRNPGYKRPGAFVSMSWLLNLITGWTKVFKFWKIKLLKEICLRGFGSKFVREKNPGIRYNFFFGGGVIVCCRPFCCFERYLDANPESCRSKQACFQLSHPSPDIN